MGKAKISVIIPVRNEAEKIERCLKSVFSQSLKPHEVIVVDGHSDDGTVEKAKEFPVKIIYENYHTRSGACQLGVENAGGEIIAFTDADCLPSPDWIRCLRAEIAGGAAAVSGPYLDDAPIGWLGRYLAAWQRTQLGARQVVDRVLFDSPLTEDNRPQAREFLDGMEPSDAVLDVHTLLAQIRRSQDELAAGLYNEAVTETSLGLRPLKTSDGELPFFAILHQSGSFVRTPAYLQGHDIRIGT